MGKSSAPDTPDYAGAARETAAGNLEAAKYATEANRANQYTPWGNLEWTNDRVFNQEAYDSALAAYQQGLSNPQQQGNPVTDPFTGQPVAGSYQGGQQPQAAPPNPEDFYSGGSRWTQNMTLSPQMQALFDQEARLQQGLFGAQNRALDSVNWQQQQQFDSTRLPEAGVALDATTLPGPGTALDYQSIMSGLPQAGTALDPSTLNMPGVFDPSSLSPMGQALRQSDLTPMGDTLNINRLPQMGEVFEGDRGNINVYDPNLQTNNATQLLLQQMNPELERNREQLRTQLANQGIMQGSEAYNRAMSQFEGSRNSAYRDAALQGINLGMQQQGLQFNQNLANRNLTAAEQLQRYQQQYGNRAMSAAEQNQLYSQMANNRNMSAAEQAQLFQQMMANRQQGQGEQAQVYGQQAGNYGLGLTAQGQQFNQQNALRGQEAQLAAALQQQQFAQQQTLRGGEAQLQQQRWQQQQAGRQQTMAEEAYFRSLPMNELNALRTGNQVSQPSFPGYAQQATTGGPDLLGAAQSQYQANLAASNASAAGQSGMMGGLFGIGGGILGGIYGGPQGAMAGAGMGSSIGGMFSDRRLKRNIRRVGQADNGLGIYAYQYIWGGPEQIGYMADEVLEHFPHAVGTRDGFLTVDYGAL